MEDKNVNKKHAYLSVISLVLTFILLALSILLFVFNSLGWFADNNKTNVDGFGIEVDSGNFLLRALKCYPVSAISVDNNSGVTTYEFTEFLENEKHQLPLYDTASLLGSKYQLALVLELNCYIKANHTISLSAEYSGEWQNNTPSLSNVVENTYANYLSNCVEIRPVTLISNQNKLTTENMKAPKTFVNVATFESSNHTQIDKNNIVISNYGSDADQELKIYLIMEYNTSLVDYYCNGLGYYQCNYTNDITFKFTSV